MTADKMVALASAGASVPVPPTHHGHSLEGWPLRSVITLAATDTAVPLARAHVRRLLRDWGFLELGEDAGLVVSELVTNAVQASARLQATPVRVWLGSDARWVLVAVADASPQLPVRPETGPDAVEGRGLALVEAFSTRCGWHPVTPRLVKEVWAEWHQPWPAGVRQPGPAEASPYVPRGTAP
jgi:anti-sigma regulatory factor (Ser/Thr protein kinase)